MTAQEFTTIAMAIKAAYPSANVMPDDSSKSVWFTMLSDLDYRVCLNAVKEHISTNRFAPTIAELREKCTARMTEPIPDAEEAWGLVMRAVRRFGYMQETDAMESLDPLTRGIVKRFGFGQLCRSENIVADRAHFIKAYEYAAKERRTEQALPAGVLAEKRQMIEQITGTMVEQIEEKMGHGQRNHTDTGKPTDDR